MEQEPIPRAEIYERVASLIEACQRYTQQTGRYIFIDVYPLDPHFGGTDEYTNELVETSGRLKG